MCVCAEDGLCAGFGGERPAKEVAHGGHVQQAFLRIQSLPGITAAQCLSTASTGNCILLAKSF